MYGRNAIPVQCAECVLNCRPVAGQPHVRRPRPECFCPVDVLEPAERLIGAECSEDSGVGENMTQRRPNESTGPSLVGLIMLPL